MSRIALYLGLIDGVLAYNSEKIAEARVKEILAGLHGPHPILKRLEVYRDLTLHSGAVGYADIPDKERTMAALQALLEEYYQELVALTDEDTAAERMRKPVKDYLSARWNEVVATRIDWYLPNLTLLDLRREKKDLASLSRGDRSKLFFETVLTAYVMDLAQTITVSTYQKKLAILKKDITAARAMILSKTGSVSINIPADDPNVVQDLCHVFNAFVDLTAFTLGEEGAAEKAQHLLSPVIDFFSPLPDKIGATDHFIYGRLSSSLPSHIPGMNATIGGGFPRGAVILFQVPSGIERNILWTHLLKDALALKGSLVAVVTTRFPKDVRNDLEHVGTKTQKLEAKNKMVFVDWYSHKNERIVGIDVSKTVVKSGKDLTNLEIGLETGIGILSNNNVGRVFFDSISAIIKGFDSKSSYSFFQSLRKKVAEKNMVAMVFVEKEMHDQKTLSWLHQVFDGVVDVSKTDHGSTIRTLSFRGRSLKTTPYSLTLSMDEVSIDEGKHKGMDKQAILDLIEKHKVKVVEAPAKEKVTREARTKEEHYRLAVELSSKREHEKAKKEFQKAIEIDDKYEDAYQALGAMLLYGTSELDEAISALEKVVALNPENGDAWFDIGNARYKKKMVYEAKNAFLFALKVKPYYRWYNGKEFICPSCTTILSVGTRRCMGCGTELDVTGKAKSPSTSEKGGMLETAPIKEPTPTPAAMPKEEGEVGTEIEIDGLEIDGLEIDGLEIDGLEIDGLEIDGLEIDGLEIDGLEIEETIDIEEPDVETTKGEAMPISKEATAPADVGDESLASQETKRLPSPRKIKKIRRTKIAKAAPSAPPSAIEPGPPVSEPEIVEEEAAEPEEGRIFLCPVCGSVVGMDDPACGQCGAMFQDMEGGDVDQDEGEAGGELGEEIEANGEVGGEQGQEDDILAEEKEESMDAMELLEMELPAHIENEEWSEVLLLTNTLMEGQGEKPEWILAKGLALTNLGEMGDALRLYKEYITHNPKNRQLLGAIGYTLLKMGKALEARRYADACLKYVPESPLAKQVLKELGEDG